MTRTATVTRTPANEVNPQMLPQVCRVPAVHELSTPGKCILTIDGKIYDVTKWADHHPGGAIIHKYHGLDATQVFKAFHGQQAWQKLKSFPTMNSKPVAPTADQRSRQILADFDSLRIEVERAGLMKTSPLWYAYKTLTTLLLFPIGMLFHSWGWYLTSALFVGTFWQQLGWLGHEYCHHQVFPNRDLNNWMGWFLGNVLQGYSGAWWKDRHNSHHAVTNILDSDPDIDNIPMLAWAPSDVKKAPVWARKTIQYQAYYFLFILPVLRLTWCFQSVLFVSSMKDSQYQFYKDWYTAEKRGLIIHWLWVGIMQLQFPTIGSAITFFLISQLLAGFGIAIVVFFNHYSCHKYPPELAENFVCLQLFTTRNMTPGIVTDWICGGLNYQIEHHLFPTMPRHSLTACSAYIKRFCVDHDLPYLCCGFYEGLKHVLSFLDEVAQVAKRRDAFD